MKTVKHQRNRIVASSLVYTLFVLAVPLVKGAGWTAWGATLVSVPLFVYAYGSFFRDSTTRRAVVWLGVMAALGFALVLVNLGGTTYIVYAAALAPIALNPKSSMIVFALLAAGMGAEMTLVGGPDGLAIGGWVILLIFVVGACNVFIGERERQNAQLRQAREDIAEMAKVAERERIARDLHDLLGHTLSVIALKSELASKVAANDPDRAVREIREVETISREALAEVRAAVEGYRSRGFSGELRNAQQALEAAGVRLDARVNHVTCSAWQEAVLALALRESVTNVVRHAQASICRVVLDANSADVVLTVHDDGIGGRVREGSGLAGMRERVTAAGGRVEFESAGGVTVRVRFPLAGASS